MSKLTKKSPAWHAEVAAELNREAVEIIALAEEADKRRARFGLMLIWVKEQGKADGSIPHGQFGPWLEAHCPMLPRSTAGDWITQGKSALDLLRWQNSEIRNFETPPHRLLAMPPDDLNGVEKERQKKLLVVIEQQKQFRALTRYTQVELKDDATVPRRGQLKGSKGLTKEQRLAANQKERGATIANLKQRIEDHGNDADELADAKHVGDPEVRAEALALLPKVANLVRFLQSLK